MDRLDAHIKESEERRKSSAALHLENVKRFDNLAYTLEVQNIYLKNIKETGESTAAQAKLTNGRVSSLESWQSFMKGGLTILTLLAVPIVIYLITHWGV